MKMMLWKELRENFKWAVLALLALTLAEFYVLSSERANVQNNNQNDLTLCSSSFLMVTSFGCAAIGAFFGVVQILPELHRDRWAALLHRPVPRGVIFFGKALAGLLLYLGATTLPFLAAACYVAMPGEFPVPFVAGMLLPGLSDLLLGSVFYFAALLLCLHRGRWFGTRGAILLSAAVVFMLHLALGSAWAAFALPPVAALVFLFGAWGAMLGTGPVGNRPWPGRIAFVLIVLVGAQAAFGIIAAVLEVIPWPWNPPPPAFTYTEFEVTQDGQVFKATSESNGENRVVTDMSGKVITDERYVGNNSYQNFCPFNYLGFDLRMEHRGYYEAGLSLRSTVRYIQPIQSSYGSKELWYLLPGRNYFIGYDLLSRRCVGICDQEGFKPPGARPKPFDQPLKGSIDYRGRVPFFWSGSQLYSFDSSERTLTPFFNAANDTIYEVTNFSNSSRPDAPSHVAVALEKTIRIFDDKGTPVLTLPYLHDPVRWGTVMIATDKAFDRIYLQSGPGFYHANWERDTPSFLDEIDLQGNVLHSYSHFNPFFYLLFFSQPTLIENAFSSLLPFGPTLVWKVCARYFSSPPPEAGDTTSLEPLSIMLLDLGILCIVGLALTVFAFRWARMAGFPKDRAAKWAVFVFLFGPAGLLTFRLTSDWPTRVLCPSCKNQRLIQEETCPSCEQAWPPPPLSGTEIFDDLKAANVT